MRHFSLHLANVHIVGCFSSNVEWFSLHPIRENALLKAQCTKWQQTNFTMDYLQAFPVRLSETYNTDISQFLQRTHKLARNAINILPRNCFVPCTQFHQWAKTDSKMCPLSKTAWIRRVSRQQQGYEMLKVRENCLLSMYSLLERRSIMKMKFQVTKFADTS